MKSQSSKVIKWHRLSIIICLWITKITTFFTDKIEQRNIWKSNILTFQKHIYKMKYVVALRYLSVRFPDFFFLEGGPTCLVMNFKNYILLSMYVQLLNTYKVTFHKSLSVTKIGIRLPFISNYVTTVFFKMSLCTPTFISKKKKIKKILRNMIPALFYRPIWTNTIVK